MWRGDGGPARGLTPPLTLLLLSLTAATTDPVSIPEMLTQSETFIRHIGQDLQLECDFHMDDLKLFVNPILWQKQQQQERHIMNIMGSIAKPFLELGRFDVEFKQTRPTYNLILKLTDLRQEDYGNYTCEVRGAGTTVLSSVTHQVFVATPIRSITVANSSRVLTDMDGDRALTFTEGVPATLLCAARGGCPPPDVRVYLGSVDLSEGFSLTHSSALRGPPGLRMIEHLTERRSDRFTVTAAHDGQRVQCVVSVQGLGSNVSTAKIRVRYAPVVLCRPARAHVGQHNVFIECVVTSRPGVHSVYWGTQHLNATSTDIAISTRYWTQNMNLGDGTMETRLYFAQATADVFQPYTVVAENDIGVTNHVVQLIRELQAPPQSAVIHVDIAKPEVKRSHPESSSYSSSSAALSNQHPRSWSRAYSCFCLLCARVLLMAVT